MSSLFTVPCVSPLGTMPCRWRARAIPLPGVRAGLDGRGGPPGRGAEKAVYDGHDNRVDDPRYRAFLMRAFGEVLARCRLLPAASILAAAPDLPLSPWGGRRSFEMAGYDKFYADDPECLARQYDFITSTEVIEHIATPAPCWTRSGAASSPAGAGVARPSGCWGRALQDLALSPRSHPLSSSSPRPRSVPWRSAGRQRSSFLMRMWRCSPNPEPGVFIWP